MALTFQHIDNDEVFSMACCRTASLSSFIEAKRVNGAEARVVQRAKSPRRGLTDQAQVRTPYTPLFGGHLRTIPHGMMPDVQPLVKSSF